MSGGRRSTQSEVRSKALRGTKPKNHAKVETTKQAGRGNKEKRNITEDVGEGHTWSRRQTIGTHLFPVLSLRLTELSSSSDVGLLGYE